VQIRLSRYVDASWQTAPRVSHARIASNLRSTTDHDDAEGVRLPGPDSLDERLFGRIAITMAAIELPGHVENVTNPFRTIAGKIYG
jgi:hypothetical protein